MYREVAIPRKLTQQPSITRRAQQQLVAYHYPGQMSLLALIVMHCDHGDFTAPSQPYLQLLAQGK